MGGHTRTILLVEDGSEAVRQPHADSEAFFRDVLQGSYLKQRELELKVAIDDDCLHELSGVTPGEFACIVFASNALIRSDGPIARAFQNCQEDIERYIGSGGCVVILHQSFPGEVWEPSFLKFLGPVRVNSRSDPSTPLAAQWRGTPLVAQFPNQVTAANLREQPGSACWRASFPLFYSHLVLADDVDLTPLLWTESDHRVLMAEMRSGGRLIMCTAPIDWAREANLTENILAYLLDGLPEVVVTGCSNVLPATTSLAMARLRSQTSVFDLRDSQPAGAASRKPS